MKKILTFRKGAQLSLRVATAVLALAFTTTDNAQLGGLLNKAKEAIKKEAKEAVKKEAKQILGYPSRVRPQWRGNLDRV